MHGKILRDVVVPGESIGIIEEFLPGEGTYVDGDVIRSLKYGIAVLNVDERRVCVKPLTRESLVPRKGDIVIGEVNGIKKDIAFVKVKKIESKNVILTSPLNCILHVSQVSNKFVEFLFDMVKVTDIIRAKVINDRPPYQLTIKDKELGVILAFCSNCQNPMIIKNRKVYCPQCRIQEERKLSTKYSLNFML